MEQLEADPRRGGREHGDGVGHAQQGAEHGERLEALQVLTAGRGGGLVVDQLAAYNLEKG